MLSTFCCHQQKIDGGQKVDFDFDTSMDGIFKGVSGRAAASRIFTAYL